MKIGVIGVGTVGESVVKILQENKDILTARTGKEMIVTKGVVKNLAKKRNVNIPLSDDVNSILDDDDIDLVVELMGGVDEPYTVIKKALQKNKAVVTANKALLAYHRYDLQDVAGEIPFEFEASVAGGIPIISSLREGLSANNILSIRGIMNGTCNYILTRMSEEGIGYKEVLVDAKRLGYAEADETLDVGGFDAAHKLLILASIAYNIDAKPEDILIEGVEKITLEEIEFAKEFGYKLKLLTIAKRIGDEVELRVHPAYIPQEEMIAKIDGVMNGVSIVGDYVGETLYYGAGAGGDATASAVVANIVDIARNDKRSPMLGFRQEDKQKLRLKKSADIETKYYIRLQVKDEAGVLAKIATILGKHNISIEKMVQKPLCNKEGDSNQVATLFIATHTCKESSTTSALSELEKQDSILKQPFLLRIEE